MPTSPVRLLALLLLAACHQDKLAQTSFLTISDNSFSPSLMRVPVGGQIAFRNWGGVLHDAIAVDGSWKTIEAHGRDELRTGEWAEVRFDKPGVYRYYCRFHGTPDGKHGMVGTVI